MMVTAQFSACARAMRPRRSWRAGYRVGGSSPVLLADYVEGRFGVKSATDFAALHGFTRASVGGCVDDRGQVTGAGPDSPRFDHHPVSGASLGLLIEDARSNTLTWSHEIDNPGWAKDNVTVQANAAVAPDGTLSADKILDTATFGHHRVKQFGLAIEAGNAYTASFFAKGAGRNVYVTLFDGSGAWNAACRFDLEAGVAVSPSGSTLIGAQMEPSGDGWFRCGLSVRTVGNSNNAQVLINVLEGPAMYAGDGVSGAYLWGAQLEAGRAASSYIPTAATTATRAADKATIALGEWFNPTAGTLLLEATLRRGTAGRYLWSLNDGLPGGNTLGVRFAQAGDGALEAVSMCQGVGEAQIALGSAPEFSVARIALSYDQSRIAASLNGSAAQTHTGVSPAGSYSVLQPGGLLAAAGNIHLRQIGYWPHAMADDAVQGLSAAR
ncbi:phage head spike fiber domain-containing protein [Phaeovulum sp.]|uniref:phage head spike fiber domain-containing protein n=1 Tax=Phaeovulum sp. TaxID=2934796 RepID=UPI0039E632E0